MVYECIGIIPWSGMHESIEWCYFFSAVVILLFFPHRLKILPKISILTIYGPHKFISFQNATHGMEKFRIRWLHSTCEKNTYVASVNTKDKIFWRSNVDANDRQIDRQWQTMIHYCVNYWECSRRNCVAYLQQVQWITRLTEIIK